MSNIEKKSHSFLALFFLTILIFNISVHGEEPGYFPPLPQDSRGFTVFTPSPNGRFVYVSEAHPGTQPRPYNLNEVGPDPRNPSIVVQAYASIDQAKSQLRDNFPDWFLIEKGTTLNQALGSWNFNGPAPETPALIASYRSVTHPSDERPHLLVPSNTYGFSKGSARGQNLALIGLFIESNNSPGPNGEIGIDWTKSGQNFLIEDCFIRGFKANAIVGSLASGAQGMNHVSVRRNIFVDSYSQSSHSEGWYNSGGDYYLFEENLWDHNGYREGLTNPTVFNHNIYISELNNGKNYIFRNNIMARGSSHGLQARTGATIDGNLFVRNPIAAFAAQNTSQIINNVVLEASDMADGTSRGWGLSYLQPGADATFLIANNLIAHSAAQFSGFGIELDHSTKFNSVLIPNKFAGSGSVSGNVIYKQKGGIKANINHDSVTYGTLPTTQQIYFSDNKVYNEDTTSHALFFYAGSVPWSHFQFQNNRLINPNRVGKLIGMAEDCILGPGPNTTARMQLNNLHASGNSSFNNFYNGFILTFPGDSLVPPPTNSDVIAAFDGLTGFANLRFSSFPRLPNSDARCLIEASEDATAGGIDANRWQLYSGETNISNSLSFPDPNRNSGSYINFLRSLGYPTAVPATFEGFIQEARAQSAANWRSEFTAQAINNYIRAGFGLNTGGPINIAPIVNAGTDQTVALPTSANLSGTVTDDGLPNPPAIVTRTWSKVSGPGTVVFGNASAASTTASFSQNGVYVLRLTANDSALTSFDDVQVTVNNPGATNTAPSVNAGPDQTIILPASANLSGTVTDDGLPNPPATVTRTWSKVSGPGTVVFGNASAASTTASFSQNGVYVLRLTANDSALTSFDDVQVTVNNPGTTNTAPSVNAGPEQTIILPASANLSGTVTDDGLPNPPATVTRTWSKVSGPGTVVFGNASAASTTASFSQAGTYVLRLTASDSALSSFDNVQIIVNENSAPGNEAPIVDAGADQTITLPRRANLSGTINDDGLPNPPGTVNQSWSMVSGPGNVIFGDDTSLTTTATFSEAGIYVLRLTASDSILTVWDDIQITVNSLGDASPFAPRAPNRLTPCSNPRGTNSDKSNPAICYEIGNPSTRTRVVITVYTKDGRLVRILKDEERASGADRVVWDGKDDSGALVASGVYFVTFEVGGFKQKSKVVIIR